MELRLTYEEQGYEGFVIMNVAKNSQRLRTLGAMGIKPKDMSPDKIQSTFEDLGNIGDLVDSSESFYKEVKLVKGEVSYNSFDDLSNDFSCLDVQIDCATKSLMGLGEVEKKSKS